MCCRHLSVCPSVCLSQAGTVPKWLNAESRKQRLNKYICRSSLLSGRNVRWPRRMLDPGESQWGACRRDRQTDGPTDGRQTVTLRFSLDAASIITARRVMRPFGQNSLNTCYNTEILRVSTWTTRMSSPVSALSCSRTCLAGFGLSLYARFNASNCLAVIVVRGRLLALSRSNSAANSFAIHLYRATLNSICKLQHRLRRQLKIRLAPSERTCMLI